MTRFLWPVAIVAGLLTSSCTPEQHAPLRIDEVRILAPLPGSVASVAYLVVSNRADRDATLLNVSSPQFKRVELHETTMSEGVSRMRHLAEVELPAGTTTRFEPGGKHIMLMEPIENIHPGVSITLNIQIDESILLVSATLQERLSLN